MMRYNWTNCPATVYTQVSAIEMVCKQFLNEHFIGMYIHGSLALGHFNEQLSDIDIIVVVNQPLNVKTRFNIIKQLLEISNQPHSIEISFITIETLNNWTYPPLFELHYSEGWREHCTKAIHEGDASSWENTYTDPDIAFHLTLVKKHGIYIYGKLIEEIIPDVPEEHFISSIIGDAELTLKQLTENPIYSLLTPWRVIAYLHSKQILSKVEAGKWAIETYLDEPLSQLVQEAIDYYELDKKPPFDFSEHLLNRYIEKINQVLKNSYKVR